MGAAAFEDLQGGEWRLVPNFEIGSQLIAPINSQMILVTSPSKPFQFNMKGLPRRSIILAEYDNEVEALYKDIEDSAQGDLQPPEDWDEESTLAFIRGVVERTLRHALADDEDIFRSGGDRCVPMP